MAKIADQYDNGNQWQAAMSYWMGFDSIKTENFYKILGESLNFFASGERATRMAQEHCVH